MFAWVLATHLLISLSPFPTSSTLTLQKSNRNNHRRCSMKKGKNICNICRKILVSNSLLKYEGTSTHKCFPMNLKIFEKTHLDYHFSKNHEALFKILMAAIGRWFLNLIIVFILDSGIKKWTCEFIILRKKFFLVSLFLNKSLPIFSKSKFFLFCISLGTDIITVK